MAEVASPDYFNLSQTFTISPFGSTTSTSAAPMIAESDGEVPAVIVSQCDRPRLVFDQWESKAVLAFCVPSIIVTIIMNLLVILALLLNQKTRNPQDWYIISMAAADLLTGLTAFPLHLYHQMRGCWDLPLWLCRVRHISSWWFVPLSEYMVAIIAFDRLLMIRYGASYKNRETRSRILVKIFAVWLGTGLATVPFNLMHLYDKAGTITRLGDCKAEFVRPGPLPLPYVLLFVCVIFPALLCLVIYALIILELRRRRIRERNRTSRPSSMMSSCTTSRQQSIVSTMHNAPSSSPSSRQPAAAVLIASVLPLITVDQNNNNNNNNSSSSHRLSVATCSPVVPPNNNFITNVTRRKSADDLLASFSSSSSFTEQQPQHHATAATAEEVMETIANDEKPNNSNSLLPLHHQSVVVALATKDEKSFSTAACAPVVVSRATATIMSCSTRYQSEKKRDTSRQRFRKAWRTMIAINGVFFGCWCPVVAGDLYLLFCLGRAHADPPCDTRLAFKIGGVLALALYINSMLNPLVYTIVMPNLRHRVLRIVCPDWLPFSKLLKRSPGTERITVSTSSARRNTAAANGGGIAKQANHAATNAPNGAGANAPVFQHQHSGGNQNTTSTSGAVSYYRTDSNELSNADASSSQYHDELSGCDEDIDIVNGKSVNAKQNPPAPQPRKSLLASDAIAIYQTQNGMRHRTASLKHPATPRRKKQLIKERASSNRVVIDSGVELGRESEKLSTRRLKGGVVRVQSVIVHSTSARKKFSPKKNRAKTFGYIEDGRGGIKDDEADEEEEEDESSGYSL